MDFAVMGTISSYVKQKNLSFAAKHKIRTGQTLTNANGNFVSVNTSTFDKLREAAKASNDQAKQQKLRRIKQKLMSGQKISQEEMGFLRVNDTKLYKKAKHAEEAREELKAELKKAKSKSEAREAMTRALVKASTDAMAELSALGQGGGAVSAGGSGNAAAMSQGDAGAMNISGGEVSAGEVSAASEGNVNISGAENQTLTEVNQSIQNSGEKATGELSQSAREEISGNRDDDKSKPTYGAEDVDTAEDIMEKFIMTIRALEDEWARFTNSDEYKNLPEHISDEVKINGTKKTRRQIAAPDRKFLDAVAVYRRAMLFDIA